MSVLNWNLATSRYAIVDLETTGLSARDDRIIEVAVYHLDPPGPPRLVLETLVNPQRPVDGTWIHGITDADVVNAPTFDALIQTIHATLQGRVVASHNIYFDERFLNAEFARRGIHAEFPHLCTMYLRAGLTAGGRATLAECCAAHGIEHSGAHRAAGDGLAAANLLATCLQMCAARSIVTFDDLRRLKSYKFVKSFQLAPWGDALPTENAAKPTPPKTARVQRKAPPKDVSARARGEYYELLIGALEDFEITEEEAAQLRSVTTAGGLQPADVREIHRAMFACASEQNSTEDAVAQNMVALRLIWTFATNEEMPVPGTLTELFQLAEAQDLSDWAAGLLDDLSFWNEPLAASDRRAPVLARQLNDLLKALIETAGVTRRLDWSELAVELVGAAPERKLRAEPSRPDPSQIEKTAIRAEFGFWARLAPWKSGARRAVADRAVSDALAEFKRAEDTWAAEMRAFNERQKAWSAAAAGALANLGLPNPVARAAFLRELRDLRNPYPVRCTATMGQPGVMCIDLVLATQSEIPGAEPVVTARSVSIKKVTRKDRSLRWELSCKILSFKVANAALNSFPGVKQVIVRGHAPATRAQILELHFVRQPAGTASVQIDELIRSWRPEAAEARKQPSKKETPTDSATNVIAPRGAEGDQARPGFDYDREQDAIMRVSKPQRARRAVQELTGMATVICFDGQISEAELSVLSQWLSANKDLSEVWPVDRVFAIMKEIMADGTATASERAALLAVLNDLCLADDVVGTAGSEIFDNVPIVLRGKTFAISGKLALGERASFLARLEARGAGIHDQVQTETDYLIVGARGSQAWATGRYGTKIERAMDLKRTGARIKIVRETAVAETLMAAESGSSGAPRT